MLAAGITALLGWVRARVRRGRRTSGIVLRTAVAVVVILVGGPPLSLSAAVARIVSHRWYSWFCV